MTEPLVTCLCLTKAGRQNFLKRAINCWIFQTYSNRELLIIPDNLDNLPHGWEHWDNPSIHIVIPMEGFSHQSLVLGKKRNFGCDHAAGELIAIWDDDDYSAPERLSFQVQSLQMTGKSVTGFQVMKFTDGSAWWQFSASPGIVLGTSLCFRRDWWDARHPNPKFRDLWPHHFEDVFVGEDTSLCKIAHDEGQLALCPDVDLMYATIHQGNTSPRRPRQDAGWIELPGFEWGKTNESAKG